MDAEAYDVAIIGAGPAGMASASELSRTGARVCVLDRANQPGGQIYRSVVDSPLAAPEQLGQDYLAGRDLVEEFKASGSIFLGNRDCWHVGANGEVLFSRDGRSERIVARKLVICPGALERPFPIPGWHKKGVMTAGNAQVLLKSSGVLCDDAVFVGTGPLLYLVAAQYLRLGARVKAILDTTQRSPFLEAIKSPRAVMAAPILAKKGLSLLSEIRSSGVRVIRGAVDVEMVGEGVLRAVSYRSGSTAETIETGHVFIHQGVIPNQNMTRALHLAHHWSQTQLCWAPTTDEWGRSSHPDIYIAGDASGIVGAYGAELTGRLVGFEIARQLGKIDERTRNVNSARYRRKLVKLNRFRSFLDRVYAPCEEHRVPKNPDTIVCRCEERTVSDLQQGFGLGACTPNSLKSETRCGMGPCQGRQCGPTVTELLATWRDMSVEDVGYYRLRSPQRLLSLDELSNLKTSPSQEQAREATT